MEEQEKIVRSDLHSLEEVLKALAKVRTRLDGIKDIAGVSSAIELLGQLDEAVEDVAADVEMDLNEMEGR